MRHLGDVQDVGFGEWALHRSMCRQVHVETFQALGIEREREVQCVGAGVCSLLFVVLVPILSSLRAPCLSHLATTASSETERNAERDKNYI